MVKLCENLMKILSTNLGLQEDRLQNAFGGQDEAGGCLRTSDEHVAGLQVRGSDDAWITVEPTPHALIVNIGDQIQMLNNSVYKSIEHKVNVNAANERLSLAFFYNPKGNVPIEPLKELVTVDTPALYTSTTYDKYRQFIRTQGPRSKSHTDELRSP
ncbi:unnamed protein product [Eruca vesicaria subsp. sativa]|uniref:Fe2OG dioxygenase domain-containing protein n=1 Tax=Eruca vesicaria subsp. sativa TaxID=29727 RepID=A0ABC8L6L7_ERUVS|nr:unnamed protein product [Eruca vesicaria subsp. sativa]